MRQGVSKAQANKELRLKVLREYMSNRNKLEYVFNSIEKLEALHEQLESDDINRLKIAIDARLKILKKYMPDAKVDEKQGEQIKHAFINYVPQNEDNVSNG